MTAALSGGYDSRLMLAVMRTLGMQPKLYVYGSNDSKDVRIALRIAAGERLALEHIDRSEPSRIEPDGYAALVERQFYEFDGFYNTGVFDDGTDIATRIERTRNGELQLNGASGEIYRNFFELPDRAMSVRRFVASFYDGFYRGICTSRFDRGRYLEGIATKIRRSLEIDRDHLERTEIDRIFPEFRVRYWVGLNSALNNTFSHVLVPYAEAAVASQSYRIGYAMKNHLRFEAELIRRLDPALAAYPSIYGHRFDKPPGLARRLSEFVARHAPPRVRAHFIARFPSPPRARPYYLGPQFLREIFGAGALAISEYVHIDRIRSPNVLSRALTLELHLRS